MKFNHLNVPDQWQNYWTRYPEGYTILEALFSWVKQVDDMVDNQNKLNTNVEQFRSEIDDFVGRFDERLQEEVIITLNDWQTSGFLDIVINEALDTKYHEMDERFKAQLAQTSINVKYFDTGSHVIEDDVDLINLAIQTGDRVFCPAGTYIIPKGKKILPKENTELFGVNGKTFFIKDDGEGIDSILEVVSPYTTPNDSIKNVSIHDIVFKDKVETLNFSEHVHLIAVRGVDGLYIYNCDLSGFRGDAILLGVEDVQQPDGVEHRRNSNVNIYNNYIDGINKDNRNGISVISGKNVKIFNNIIKNTTRSNMPGGIDIEPNPYPVYVIENIEVYGNVLDNIGGNVGAIAVFCPINTTPKNISIHDNVLTNTRTNFYVYIADSSYNSGIAINNNKCSVAGRYGLFVWGEIRGLKIKDNDLLKIGSLGMMLGYDATSNLSLYDAEITDNTIETISAEIAFQVTQTNNVKITDNTFINSSTGVVLKFGVSAASILKQLYFDNNTIVCVGQTPTYISTVTGTVDYSTNTFINNKSNKKFQIGNIPAMPRQDNLIGGVGQVTGNTLLDDFPEGVSRCVLNNAAGTPGGLGFLTTVKIDPASQLAYRGPSHQRYSRSDTYTEYTRYWNQTDGAWSSWYKTLTEKVV